MDYYKQLREYLQYNNLETSKNFINKLFDITYFSVKFFREEIDELDNNSLCEAQEWVEMLLLMNLN
jgi:valyl-tRNA synthetase